MLAGRPRGSQAAGEEAGQTPGLSAALVQCFMHRRPRSPLLSRCALGLQGRAGAGERGLLAGSIVGVRKGRKGPEGRCRIGGGMPGVAVEQS